MVFTILWRRQSKAAAILSPILGMATGLAVWLSTAHKFGRTVSVSTTGEVLPCVYGTVASFLSPILYSVVITLIRPQNYDWAEFKKERLALEEVKPDLTTVDDKSHRGRSEHTIEEGDSYTHAPGFSQKDLKRWSRMAAFWTIATFLGHWVLWPLPMYGANYIFGKKVS